MRHSFREDAQLVVYVLLVLPSLFLCLSNMFQDLILDNLPSTFFSDTILLTLCDIASSMGNVEEAWN